MNAISYFTGTTDIFFLNTGMNCRTFQHPHILHKITITWFHFIYVYVYELVSLRVKRETKNWINYFVPVILNACVWIRIGLLLRNAIDIDF